MSSVVVPGLLLVSLGALQRSHVEVVDGQAGGCQDVGEKCLEDGRRRYSDITEGVHVLQDGARETALPYALIDEDVWLVSTWRRGLCAKRCGSRGPFHFLYTSLRQR